MLPQLTLWTLLGTAGIWCIELSYLPQIMRLYKRKDAEDISLFFPGLNMVGRIMAMIYATHVGEQVLAVGFMVGIMMRGTLLAQVIYYRWLRQRVYSSALATAVIEEH